MRRFSIPLLALIVVSVISLMIGVSSSANRDRRSVLPSPVPVVPQQPAGMIDGSATPALIPDRVAYSLLFRLLSNRHTEAEKTRIRAYAKQMDLRDVDSLLAVVEDFERRVGILDRKAQRIHERNGPNLDSHALTQLNELQRRKEEIVAEIVASLPDRLGADSMEKLRRHVNERVKPRVRMNPDHIHN